MSSRPPNSPPVRVLIADDSAVMRAVLCRALESAPWLQICGTAQHGIETLEKVRELQPDVVTLDAEMEDLNGLQVLKEIMQECPRPVIMLSSANEQGAEATVTALSMGAFDGISKAGPGTIDPRKLKRELLGKIEAAAQSAYVRKMGTEMVDALVESNFRGRSRQPGNYCDWNVYWRT